MTSNILLYFFLFSFLASYSQNTKGLIDEKNTLIKEIEYTKDLLSQAKTEKENSLYTLNLFQKDIELRKSLIQNLDNEINNIQNNIDTLICRLNILYINEYYLKSSIKKKNDKIDNLYSLYSQSIRNIYLSEKYQNFTNILLSGTSIDESINNYIYFKSIVKTSQTLSKKLNKEKKLLTQQTNKLNNNKSTIVLSVNNCFTLFKNKQFFRNDKENQLDSILNQKEKEQNLVDELNNEIDKLNKEISVKEESALIIENEIKIALSKENSKNTTINFESLSKEFQQQKGKLDWPVNDFIVMSRFGKVSHPSMPGIHYINNGIELAVPRGTLVKSVYSGVVSTIIIQNNFLKSIIIDHGLYFTVYTNLAEVYFQQGDIVELNQPIAMVFVKEKHKTGITEFQIWKEFESQDPKIWLKNVK